MFWGTLLYTHCPPGRLWRAFSESESTMASQEHVLIAGCGRLGIALGEALADAGHRVTGLRRHPEAIPAPLTPLAADLHQPDSLLQLPGDVDLVYCILTPDDYSDAGYWRTYHDGMIGLLHGLQRAGATPRRLIFVSSTSVYGRDDGRWVDEWTEAEPATQRAEALLAAEQLAFQSDSEATVVRFSGIYGPGREHLVEAVRQGKPCRPHHWTNRIHEEDCVRVLTHLALPEVEPTLYIGTDCEPVQHCVVADWLADRLGVPYPPRDENETAVTGKRLSNSFLLASGFRFMYPDFRSGYGFVRRCRDQPPS